jgi:beta-glucosidase
MSSRRLGIALQVGTIVLCITSSFAQSAQSGDAAALAARIDSIASKMTLEEKIDYIGGTGFAIRAMPNLGLPAFEMSDGPYGTRSNAGFPSTTYAAGIGLAASWNPELAARVGAGIGKDARARGVHYMLGPGVNIYRSPKNGRNFEYFGEDPFLSAAITTGYITGMQKQGVSATVKHFMGNNSEFLRHDSDSLIDERTMREIYLPAFEAAVKRAHVGAIMDSYNLTNGQHMTQNSYFNTDIARKQWGFKGVMMSDWVATYDGVAAANGGLDIEMPKGTYMNRKNLLPAVQDGRLSKETIDEKVRHILETAGQFGWLDREQTDLALSTYSRDDQETALDAARESMVLLKNEGNLLPLEKSAVKTILVVGPDAYPGVAVGGGSAGVKPFRMVSVLEGMGNYVGKGASVFYDRGIETLIEVARQTKIWTDASGKERGVKMEFYKNPNLSGEPVSTTFEHAIDTGGVGWDTIADDPETAMDLFAANVKKQMSRRWTGYYIADQDGTYEIALQGAGEGGGNRMYLDDKLLFDEWRLVRDFQPHVTMHLAAGPHKVVVEDFQDAPFGGRLRLAIKDQSKLVSAKTKSLAAKADVVVIAAGYDNDSESEGGDRTFELPIGQDELIREVVAANKKTIVAVTSGGNVDSSAWINSVPAYVEMWYPGEQGGTALAEILFGAFNPSGHLPATFERKWEDNPTYANYYPQGDGIQVAYKEGIFVGYRGYEKNGTKPLFPFGYGLSYTTFKYSNLAVITERAGPRYAITFDVTNTGKRAGATVAQVYVSDSHASVPRPQKELKGFEKVVLKPGEKRHVSIPLDGRAFAYYDVEAKGWHIAPGEFGILVGQSSDQPELKGSVTISEATAKVVE